MREVEIRNEVNLVRDLVKDGDHPLHMGDAERGVQKLPLATVLVTCITL